MNNESPEFLYQCLIPTCKRKLNNLELMKKHVRVHFKNRPYKCKYCPKSYTQKGNMMKHQKIHEQPELDDRRLYKCRY